MKFTSVICFLFIQVIRLTVYCEVTNENVWLTVSSTLSNINGKVNQRMLELNWKNIKFGSGHWIGLFHNKLGKLCPHSRSVLTLQPIERNGKYRTRFEFPVKIFTEKDVSTKCLGYYIAYCKSRRLITQNCLQLNAKWMEENYEYIRHRSIRSLMIPGTHNSASYSQGFKVFNFLQERIDNYAICQDENIFTQLMYGIRYLDLRVMFDGNDFWMTHDVFRMNTTLDSVLQQIRRFMDSTSKEVVIVDFHRFPKGFSENKDGKHSMLLNIIEHRLQPYLSTVTDNIYNVTLEKLVTSGKRVIIGYMEENIHRPSYLYPAVRHRWANADEITPLYLFMKQNIVCSQKNSLIAEAAMAELTPRPAKVVFNVYGGLRQMADNVNSEVTKWFLDELSCANIVATDFFLGNNLIQVSISSNRDKDGKHT